MANYLSKRQYSSAKARLTRAQKKGPLHVIDEVKRTFAEWDDGDYAWPDGWARWQRAHDDATMEMRFKEWRMP